MPSPHFKLVAVEQRLEPALFLIVNDVIPAGGVVIRFDDEGDVVEAEGTVARLEFVVPHLPDMTELVVERAEVEVRGRRIDQSPVSRAKASSSSTFDLEGRSGGLRRVDLRGLGVQPGTPDDVQLEATSGTPTVYRWRVEGDEIDFSTSSGGKQLHLMVRPHDGSGFGPPQTAVPRYDMPDNAAGMYGPVLSGASVTLDDPVSGAARVTFEPPVESARVQLFMGTNDETAAHAGLPHEATAVNWTAGEVAATWASAPTEVALTATAGDADPVPVASFPNELSAAPAIVDFTPAARALLTGAHESSTGNDLVLAIDATSNTAGELIATSLELTAHYRLDSIGSDGVNVALRGAPQSVEIPIGDGLRPARLTLTVDGSFGPAVRVTASDGERPGRRSGLRLAEASRGSRRVTLTTLERARPLARISVYGRADEPTELILGLLRDQGGRMGPPLGEPTALRIEPGLSPAWHRADLAVPTEPARGDAVWVTAQVSTGRLWWFADPTESTASPATDPRPDRVAMTSADGGSTWWAVAARPVVQVHYLAERPEPAPISVRGPGGLLAPDVLALPAARSLVEMTLLDAIQRGLTEGGATPKELERQTASVTFRKEGIEPIADLASMTGIGDLLELTFDGDRDADFRVLDATLTYDPWAAR